jgi:hypothetical protein
MAILASIFGVLGRFAGKFLTTTLGWASTLLFGRIPADRQVWFAVLTFGSLVWVATLVGILVPSIGTFLIALVPLPEWVNEDAVRWAMIGAALLIPPLLGAVTLLIADPADRPGGVAAIGAIVRGYALTPVLAGTLVILAGAGIVRKLRAVIGRRSTGHVAIVVRPRRYDALVARLEKVLGGLGVIDRVEDASGIMTGPPRLLASISGAGIRSLVPDRLAILKGARLEVQVYPSDLALSGRKLEVARARAAIMRELRSEDCWFTTDRKAQAIEDQLAALGQPAGVADAAALEAIDRRLATEEIADDAWDVLYRRRLQVIADATGSDIGEGGARDQLEAIDGAAEEHLRPPIRLARPSFGTILGSLMTALMVLDVVLVLRPPKQRR